MIPLLSAQTFSESCCTPDICSDNALEHKAGEGWCRVPAEAKAAELGSSGGDGGTAEKQAGAWPDQDRRDQPLVSLSPRGRWPGRGRPLRFTETGLSVQQTRAPLTNSPVILNLHLNRCTRGTSTTRAALRELPVTHSGPHRTLLTRSPCELQQGASGFPPPAGASPAPRSLPPAGREPPRSCGCW